MTPQRQQGMAWQQDLARAQAQQQELAQQEIARQQELAQAEIAQAVWTRWQEEKARADNWMRQERYRPEKEWMTG